jgi:hypothetical protein
MAGWAATHRRTAGCSGASKYLRLGAAAKPRDSDRNTVASALREDAWTYRPSTHSANIAHSNRRHVLHRRHGVGVPGDTRSDSWQPSPDRGIVAACRATEAGEPHHFAPGRHYPHRSALPLGVSGLLGVRLGGGEDVVSAAGLPGGWGPRVPKKLEGEQAAIAADERARQEEAEQLAWPRR